MSEVVTKAVEALNEKMGTDGFDGSIKIVIEDEGSILINENGAIASDADADCTMTSSAETLQGIMAQEINPTTAFMTGKLSVSGDMTVAMKLGSVLG